MAPVSKMLIGGVALATLQGCGGPNKDTNLETKVDMTDALGTNNDVDENDVAEVKSNIAQIDAAENIGEKVVANVSGQGVESVRKTAARNVEDLQKKPQQIWNAVMSKKGGAIAAGVALTGTLATAIGYKVKQHRAQAGRTCTAVGEGVSNKFKGVSYYDGQKVNFECATGYTLTTDDEVTVECDANGEARITACSKNSWMILGYPLRKIVKPVLALGVVGFAACLIFRSDTEIQKATKAVISEINVLVKKPESESARKDYVNKCYGNNGSSTEWKALLNVIDDLQNKSDDQNKATGKQLATFVDEKIAEMKLQQKEINAVNSVFNKLVEDQESATAIKDHIEKCFLMMFRNKSDDQNKATGKQLAAFVNKKITETKTISATPTAEQGKEPGQK